VSESNEPLLVQYEMLWKNIEYLDSGIFKVIGLYGVLEGALLANLEKFHNYPYSSAILIIIISGIFILLLHRTSKLAAIQAEKIRTVEQKMSDTFKDRVVPSLFPTQYGKGMTTSLVSIMGIILMTGITVILLVFDMSF